MANPIFLRAENVDTTSRLGVVIAGDLLGHRGSVQAGSAGATVNEATTPPDVAVHDETRSPAVCASFSAEGARK